MLRKMQAPMQGLKGVKWSHTKPTVAVLYQAIEPPVINGVRKPRKPGGYQDSGADIAYALRAKGIEVITPRSSPPVDHEGWCFPDSEEGILSAVTKGATHLWANTIVFSSHPLQTASSLDSYAPTLRVVGQPPGLVEKFDDKMYLNNLLRALGGFTLPKAWEATAGDDLDALVKSIPNYPIVGKPVRGRGSHGVKVCNGATELKEHIESLLDESPVVLLEEFLAGEEATITVMPPTPDKAQYWSMPPVTRFNHQGGVAPYNGTVAVTANSRVVSEGEMHDATYGSVMRQCEGVASLIRATAPIRIDVRRFRPNSEFAIFDINMKPNMTGPGRPGREDQASLTALAAAGCGWDYQSLLEHILYGASTLQTFREYQSPL
ncbi:ATP-grasp fold subdomain 1 [Penicillium brevicompactum]|uniref:ATP-grasp fold subdomain 1 n=1 Tax=Penicillium brevicompactum TaxID=5074 RepID=A0A9W9R606_PENBR|nr:ATP-grasp fold subdomain 1 [Penicillium brevicompactum]